MYVLSVFGGKGVIRADPGIKKGDGGGGGIAKL